MPIWLQLAMALSTVHLASKPPCSSLHTAMMPRYSPFSVLSTFAVGPAPPTLEPAPPEEATGEKPPGIELVRTGGT